MCLLGTFAERTVVNEASCIKVDPDVPLDKACLLGCGVVTGWGSAVYAADVTPGDDVAVVGIGGIGINAVQGAKLAGAHRIFAIDPVPFKRDQAMQFGATHTAASLEEATPLIRDVTWGRMANKVIMTMGVGDGDLIGAALAITAKRGRVVITNIHSAGPRPRSRMSGIDLTLMEKQVVGSLFGSANPRADIPEAAGPLRRRPAQARRAGHPDLPPRRDQRRLRGHARGPQPAGRHQLLRAAVTTGPHGPRPVAPGGGSAARRLSALPAASSVEDGPAGPAALQLEEPVGPRHQHHAIPQAARPPRHAGSG